MHPDDEALIRAYLAGRDVACPACSYNLRDLREARCPECGCTLAIKGEILRVRGMPARPPRKPGDWMHRVGMAGLTTVSVVSGLMAFGLLSSGHEMIDANREWDQTAFSAVMIVFVVHLSLVLILSNLKPQFQRRSRVFQRVVMLLCWYWLPILLTLFVALIV